MSKSSGKFLIDFLNGLDLTQQQILFLVWFLILSPFLFLIVRAYVKRNSRRFFRDPYRRKGSSVRVQENSSLPRRPKAKEEIAVKSSHPVKK